jgi:phospholipid/cholesterol/gamma-HCH transport system substrate-binding protein
MKERNRNIAVGLTVIVAAAMLGGMIVIFSVLPQSLQPGYDVRMEADQSYDIHPGDTVFMAGIRIGAISQVRFTDAANPTKGVTMVANISREYGVPAGSALHVYSKGFVGGSYLTIQSDKPQRDDKGQVVMLPKDRESTIAIVREESGGGSILPPEAKPALVALTKLAENLNALISPQPSGGGASGSQPATQGGPSASGPAGAPAGNIQDMIAKMNRTMDNFNAVMGDPGNQANLKISLANLAKATASADEAMTSLKALAIDAQKTFKDVGTMAQTGSQRMDEIAKRLVEDAQGLSALLDTLNKAAIKIESGQGTLGLMVNDPKLYNSLVDAAKQMTQMLKDMQDLMDKWKQQGVPIKVK